jgi:hypothetical protein
MRCNGCIEAQLEDENEHFPECSLPPDFSLSLSPGRRHRASVVPARPASTGGARLRQQVRHDHRPAEAAERGLGWTVVVTNLLAKARSEAGRLSLGGRLRQAGVAQVHGPVGWRLLGV